MLRDIGPSHHNATAHLITAQAHALPYRSPPRVIAWPVPKTSNLASRTDATNGLLTPQSRRKRTPEDAHHLESIPETAERPACRPLQVDPTALRQPCFGELYTRLHGPVSEVSRSSACVLDAPQEALREACWM